MCGIVGFIASEKTVKNSNFDASSVLKDMISTLIHRGPDEEGIFVDRGIGLGNRRLSIIDLKTGNQPIFDHDRKIIIVFNGEIYNFQKLKEKLQHEGVNFETSGDTEVILQSYKMHGPDAVKQFNGMWAFAILDLKKNILFLSRDRFGKKPLYYGFTEQGDFIFGSELKALRKFPSCPTAMSEQALMQYLTFGYIPEPLAIYEKLFKLQAGHSMIIDIQRFHVGNAEKYTFLDPLGRPPPASLSPRSLASPKARHQAARCGMSRKEYFSAFDALYEIDYEKSDEDWTIGILQHLEQSVRHRLIADVPVGAFLSGGVDSSAVVAAIKKIQPQSELHTFSIGFENPLHDETRFAQIAAERFETIHHVEILSQARALEILMRLPYFYDEPFADSSMMPTFAVSELARKHVKVALSGDGGDELFGGYGNYVFFRFLSLVSKFFMPSLSRLAAPFTRFIRNKFFPFDRFPKQNLALTALSPVESKPFSQFAFISSLGVLRDQPSFEIFKPYFKFNHWLSNVTAAYFHTHLPDDFLVKVDRASMANSLEIRCPFLDANFVQFALTIPPEKKIRGSLFHGWQKKILFKQAMQGYLPQIILKRKKHGFTMPVSEMLFEHSPEFLKEKLDQLLKRDILPFGKKFLDELLSNHHRKHQDISQFFYALLMLELWCEEWQ